MGLIARPYQREGCDFLAGRSHAMLADEMRVGKTPQAIMAADKVEARRILVVCPAIATEHWRSEFARWSPNRPPAYVLGVDKNAPPECFNGVVIASYDRARKAWEQLGQQSWDVFIPDEAHFAKNPLAARTKMVYGKTGLGWKSKHIWPLTGTPAPNHVGELWPMLRAFGGTELSYGEFVKHYCYVDAEGRIRGNRPERLASARDLVRPFIKRRTRAMVAPEVPEIGIAELEFEPATVDLATEELESVDRENRIEVAKAKAIQLAGEIRECFEGNCYAQTVVFGVHLEPLADLEVLLRQAGITAASITGKTSSGDRQRIQAMFAMGTLQVLLGQVLACGTAIDLSYARHGYMLELDFVPANNEQAMSRLVNVALPDKVTFDVCSWPGTVDNAVQRVLLRKIQNAVINKEYT